MVGVWHIKGTITAREWHRRHDAHLYKTDGQAVTVAHWS